MKLTGLLGGSCNRRMRDRAITQFRDRGDPKREVWWGFEGHPLKPPRVWRARGTLRAAREMARRAPIAHRDRTRLGTRYKIDTWRTRAPFRGSNSSGDGGGQSRPFQWKDWREIAREMPIAVIARPGYDDRALASPAMAWLRRHRLTAAEFRHRDEWSAPALIELRFDPDPRSATEIRRADPDWASRFTGPSLRDGVTHSLIHDPEHRKGEGA